MTIRVKSGGLVLLLLLIAVLVICFRGSLVPENSAVKTVPRLSGARSQENSTPMPPIAEEQSTPVPSLARPKTVADKSP